MQHDGHRQHKTKQHGQCTQGQCHPCMPPLQAQGLRLLAVSVATPCDKTQTRLRTLLGAEQHHNHHQQHGGQLRCGHAVVHHQPSFVNARREGLNAKVTRHPKVGQGFHQGQRGASRNRRACQRQSHLKNTPTQRCAQQTRRLHQMVGAFRQSGACQQIHIGVQGQGEHTCRTPLTAHFGQHASFEPTCAAHPSLHWPTELQKVGVGIRHHISRHGQWQQQGPLQRAAQWKVKQGHRRG